MIVSIVDRLKQFMEHVGLQSTQFADAARVPRPTISQILNGRNRKISNELLDKLHQAFPALNIMWLLYGEGEMEDASKIKTSERQNTHNYTQAAQQVADNQPTLPFEEQNLSRTVDLPTSTIQQLVENSALKKVDPDPQPVTSGSDRDKLKKITSVIVFYSDGTMDVFKPAYS